MPRRWSRVSYDTEQKYNTEKGKHSCSTTQGKRAKRRPVWSWAGSRCKKRKGKKGIKRAREDPSTCNLSGTDPCIDPLFDFLYDIAVMLTRQVMQLYRAQ